MFGTTNYPEKLLPSLTRSGRLGNSFEFGYPNDASILKAIRFYFPSLGGAAAQSVLEGIRELERKVKLVTTTENEANQKTETEPTGGKAEDANQKPAKVQRGEEERKLRGERRRAAEHESEPMLEGSYTGSRADAGPSAELVIAIHMLVDAMSSEQGGGGERQRSAGRRRGPRNHQQQQPSATAAGLSTEPGSGGSAVVAQVFRGFTMATLSSFLREEARKETPERELGIQLCAALDEAAAADLHKRASPPTA